MATDTKVMLYTSTVTQNELGESIDTPTLWRTVWCQATASGGSRRTYAGRIVGEHHVVLTTHWRDGIDKCRFVEFDGLLRPIIDVVAEGRKRKAHILTFTSDTSYGE